MGKKRLWIYLVFFSMILGMFLRNPEITYAQSNYGQVHITIENTTYKEEGAVWSGTLIDTQTDIAYSGMNMMKAISAALKQNGYPEPVGAENGYITEINGLSANITEINGASWMVTLDDWFVNDRLDKFTVQDGDEICVMFSVDLGNDIGALRDDTETKLSSLKFNQGNLSSEFDNNNTNYTLDLPQGTDEVQVLPEAKNKNYQVRTYKGNNPDVSEKGYRKGESISVEAGDVITIICGDNSWPSSVQTPGTATVYKIKISIAGSINCIPKVVKESCEEDVIVNNVYSLNLSDYFSDGDGDQLTYFVSVDESDFIETESDYSFTPTKEGEYLLKFKANDGKTDSDVYEVRLSVDSGNKYKISVENSDNGIVSSDLNEAAKNEMVTLTFTPNSNYALKNLVVKTKTGTELPLKLENKNYCFKMPSEEVSVEAVFSVKRTLKIYGTNTGGFDVKIYNSKQLEIANQKSGLYRTVNATDEEYTYIIKREDQELKNGIIKIEENETKKDVFFIRTSFELKGSLLSENVDKGIKEVIVRDAEGNELESIESLSSKCSTGGYNSIMYILDAGKEYTYEATMTDEKWDISDGCSGKISYAENMKYSNNVQRVYLTPSLEKYICTFRISKGANAKLFRHPGVAYKNYEPVSWLEPENEELNTDLEYDVYQVKLRKDSNYIIIMGGAETSYRKCGFFFMSPPNNVQATIDLNAKKSVSSGRKYVASNDLYTSVGGNSVYLTMNQNEQVRLEGFRVEQTVTDSISNQFVEPDMHYEVIQGDSVSLNSAGAPGREFQMLTATKKGTSIIKVTYDDIDIWETGILGQGSPDKYYCDSIDDINTGIVIVNVGGNSGEIQSNTNLNMYDTVYFASKITMPDGTWKNGTESASYTFKPTAGNVSISTVRIRTPYLGTGNWNDESAWITCQSDEDGSYTVDLKNGRNIIEITDSEGNVLYDTINAKAVELNIINNTHSGKNPRIGDSIGVSFDGLELPIYKMCGIYNPGFPDTTWVEYRDADGNIARSAGVQYAIHLYNTVTFDVNKSGEFTLSGGKIHCGHLGSPLNAHLDISLDGAPPNLNASAGTNSPYFCILPDITLTVDGGEANVIEFIDEIDREHPLNSIKEIMAAQKAYESLTNEEKEKVTNYKILEDAYKEIKDVIEVVTAIDGLPVSVDVSDGNAVASVTTVNAKYKALSQEEKEAVYNLYKLTDLLASIQEQKESADKVQNVISQIQNLPELDKMTLDENVLNAVSRAQGAYNTLTAEEKQKVTNISKLLLLQERIPVLRAAQTAIDSITAIGEITEHNYAEKEASIITARNAYDALEQEQKAFVTNLSVLEQAEYDFALLRGDEDVKEIMRAIHRLCEDTNAQGDTVPGPLAQTETSGEATWEIWAFWKDYVVNVRGLVNQIAVGKTDQIENLGDLEQAENYISTLEVTDVQVLLDELPDAENVGEYGSTDKVQLSPDEISAIAAALSAYNDLTDEQRQQLTTDSVDNLAALDLTACSYENYISEYLQVYVEELAAVYQQYKDKSLPRSEMTVVQRILGKYDVYNADNQAALATMTSVSSAEITFAEMKEELSVLLAQTEADIQAAQEISQWILSLPTDIHAANVMVVRKELNAIQQQFQKMNENAQSYVRYLDHYETLKTVVAIVREEVDSFKEYKPEVGAEAEAYNRVVITWEQAANANAYRVYRKTGSGGWKRIATTGNLSYVDKTAGNTTYYYTVKALGNKWGSLVASDYDHIGAKVVTPFGGKTTWKSAKSAGYNSVKLTWGKVKGADGYRIYRASTEDGKYKMIKAVTGEGTVTYTNTGLTSGKMYYYKVRAFKKSGNKYGYTSYSKVISAKPVPTAPKLHVIAGSKKAVLKWSGVKGASGYIVYRSDSKNGTYKTVKSIKGVNTLTYTNGKLRSKKSYYYKVRAYRTVGGKRIYSSYSFAKKATVK